MIDDPIYGYRHVNVADQRRDPNSLLNWTERIIRTRKECAEIGWGDWRLLPRLPDGVLGIRYDWSGRATIVLHNFRDQPVTVRLRVDGENGRRLVNLLSPDFSDADDSGHHTVELEAYGYRWLRVGDSERPLVEDKV